MPNGDHEARMYDVAKFQGFVGERLEGICVDVGEIKERVGKQNGIIAEHGKALERHSTNWSWLRRIALWVGSPAIGVAGVAAVGKLLGFW